MKTYYEHSGMDRTPTTTRDDWRILRERKWDWHDQHLVVRPFVDALVAEIERLKAFSEGLKDMATEKNGPALPLAYTRVDTGEQVVHNGLSLRDYFAAKALAGICGDGIPGGHHRSEITAREAYAYADAMLIERAK